MQPRPLVTSIAGRRMGRPAATCPAARRHLVTSAVLEREAGTRKKTGSRYSHAEAERPHSKGVALSRIAPVSGRSVGWH